MSPAVHKMDGVCLTLNLPNLDRFSLTCFALT